MEPFHYYTKGTQGRISFAGIVHDNQMSIGISVCGKKEHFVRAKGRTIAEGRAKSKTPFKVINDVPKDFKSLTKLFVSTVTAIEETLSPERLKRLIHIKNQPLKIVE